MTSSNLLAGRSWEERTERHVLSHRPTGVKRANEAGQAPESILKAVVAVTKQVGEIAAAGQQMSASANELIGAMDGVSAVVEENTAATEEMAASSGEVSQAIEGVASVSEENSAAAQEVSAAVEEMTAQVEEVNASTQSLTEMAETLLLEVSRFRMKNMDVRCWEIMQCGDNARKCPAYQAEEDRCWLIEGTWCGGVLQGDVRAKIHNCVNCKYYHQQDVKTVAASSVPVYAGGNGRHAEPALG